MDGETMRTVAASTVTLTDNTTNYVEVSMSGTVSKNTTGFTEGNIPLFSVVTAAGVISSTTDKRAYFTPSYTTLFTLSSSVITTTKDMKIGTGTLKDWDSTYNFLQVGGNSALVYSGTAGAGSEFHIVNNAYFDDTNDRWEYISADEASRITLEDGKFKVDIAVTGVANNAITWLNCITVDDNKNLLLNAASKPNDSIGSINIAQGTDPTSSPADQISIFATSGADCTLGIRAEESVDADVDETQFSHKFRININGTEYYLMLIAV
ncbi:MAG: hypothetical protein ACFFDH_00405 [Promethearchaeota archaeon]